MAETQSGAYGWGQLAVVLAFALIASIFLIKARKAKTRSLLLSNLSFFAGLLVFAQVELISGWIESRNPVLLGISGVVRLALGLSGLACAFAAIVLRKRDSGVGVARPMAGMTLSLLHAVLGFGLLFLPAFHAPPAPEESWVYQSQEHKISVTLPSRDWVQARIKGAAAAFRSRRLPIIVGVFIQEGGKGVYEKDISGFKEQEIKASRAISAEEGRTPAGDPYFLAEGSESRPDGSGEFLITTCFVFRENINQTVTFIIEAQPRMKSALGSSSEYDALRNQARSISLSLR